MGYFYEHCEQDTDEFGPVICPDCCTEDCGYFDTEECGEEAEAE